MSDETIITTDTESTYSPVVTPVAPAPAASAAPVPMKRDFRKGGKGVVKMLVPAEQVADFKAAGWTEA